MTLCQSGASTPKTQDGAATGDPAARAREFAGAAERLSCILRRRSRGLDLGSFRVVAGRLHGWPEPGLNRLEIGYRDPVAAGFWIVLGGCERSLCSRLLSG